MSFLDLDTPTLFQQFRTPSLKRRDSPPSLTTVSPSFTTSPTSSMKALPPLPNPAFKASLPRRHKTRDNLPPPLQLESVSYSRHKVQLSTVPPDSGFEPLSPFVAPGDKEVVEPESPTSLHSPSLWLSPTGLVEPVGPTMTAGTHVSSHWVIEGEEISPSRSSSSQMNINYHLPTTPPRAPAVPASAFDSDDENDSEAEKSSSSVRGRVKAFVWGSGGKPTKSPSNENHAAKSSRGHSKSLSGGIRLSLFSKTVTPVPPADSLPSTQPSKIVDVFSRTSTSFFADEENEPSNFPVHSNATGARRPSLVESLLLSGNSSAEHSAVTNVSPTRPSTISPTPYPYISPSPNSLTVPRSARNVRHGNRFSTTSAAESLLDFDFDLFPMMAPYNNNDSNSQYAHLFPSSGDGAGAASNAFAFVDDEDDDNFAIINGIAI